MRGHYTCPVLIWVPDFYIGNYLRAARGRERVSELTASDCREGIKAPRCECVRVDGATDLSCYLAFTILFLNKAPDESKVFNDLT